MCIIAIKPAGPFDRTARQYLRNCFDNNPDGAGYMYQTTGAVHVVKGFMKWTELERALDTLPTDRSIVFHFRFATHGAIVPGLCHPFPITRKRVQAQRLDTLCDRAIVHNGVIHGLCEYGASGETSDTLELATGLLPLMGKALHHVKAWSQVARLTSSKFGYMDSTRILYAGAFVKVDGWLFSNDGYTAPKGHVGKFTIDDEILAEWEREWDSDRNYALASDDGLDQYDDRLDCEDNLDAYLAMLEEHPRRGWLSRVKLRR